MKKVISKKVAQKQNDPLFVDDVYLPSELARISHAYYEAFLVKGFSASDAFALTRQVIESYLRT